MTVKHQILIGTSNPKKLREMQALLASDGDLNCEVLKLDDVAPDLESPEETGETFIANAELKALYFANHTGLICIADDSGLEVDALNGAPGIFSARYAEEKGDAANNAKLIHELQGVSDAERGAGYRCAIAVAAPGKILERFEATCRGRIVDEARGDGGFGYDPHFFVPELDRTFAEVSAEQKAEISHRGQALRRLRADLPAILSILDNSQNL